MTALATVEKLKNGTPVRIVALGDSLTYGWMVPKGYLDFLEDMLVEKHPECRVKIINRGIPGDTARGGLHRLDRHVLGENPDLVFVQFALNDAFTGCAPDQYSRHLAAIVDRIRSASPAEVLLLTSIAPGNGHDDLQAEEFYARIERVAAGKTVPVARVHAWWKQRIAEGVPHEHILQADQVHPTVEGYRLMAEAVMQEL